MGLKAGRDSGTTLRDTDDPQELVDYCARPKCREEFRRSAGPGRRQAFCSEFCRRSAERELRQARARLQHFEELVVQLRGDVAAFGKSPGSGGPELDDVHLVQRDAEIAMARVAGILAFPGDGSDPVLQELRSFHDAVAPLVALNRDH